VEAVETKVDKETTKKYLAVISLINETEKYLRGSELANILLNICVFFPTIFYISSVINRSLQTISSLDMFFILLCHVIGLSLNTYAVASSMRTQLKLKLRYFQARFLERKINNAGEFIISDESSFFDSDIGKIESPDGKETLLYPKKGLLRMDGFIGSAKPRVLSLLIPLMFFIIYSGSFISLFVMLF